MKVKDLINFVVNVTDDTYCVFSRKEYGWDYDTYSNLVKMYGELKCKIEFTNNIMYINEV